MGRCPHVGYYTPGPAAGQALRDWHGWGRSRPWTAQPGFHRMPHHLSALQFPPQEGPGSPRVQLLPCPGTTGVTQCSVRGAEHRQMLTHISTLTRHTHKHRSQSHSYTYYTHSCAYPHTAHTLTTQQTKITDLYTHTRAYILEEQGTVYTQPCTTQFMNTPHTHRHSCALTDTHTCSYSHMEHSLLHTTHTQTCTTHMPHTLFHSPCPDTAL